MNQEVFEQITKEPLAIIGGTGSGKTYAAGGLTELLVKAGKRSCILDPTDVWWGLRSGADGKSVGLPVVIFGGRHADVPLHPSAGKAMGEYVAKSDAPSIVSLAHMGKEEMDKFAEDFFNSVYLMNRRPLQLVVDEADEFAPEGGKKNATSGGTLDRIVRRGRVFGFRPTMITQRPAVINKNVLSQAKAMIVFQFTGSQDREAVAKWIKGQMDAKEAAAIINSLSSLPRGEGWLLAPRLGIAERMKFPKKETFDSSRTPEDEDERIDVEVMRAVDIAGITKAMQATIEEVKANDPVELKKQIAELKEKLQGERLKPIDAHAGEVEKLQQELANYRKSYESIVSALDAALSRPIEINRLFAQAQLQLDAHIHFLSSRSSYRIASNPDSPRETPESIATQAPEGTTHKALAERPVPAVAPPQDRLAAGIARTKSMPVGYKPTSPSRELEKGPGLILDAIAWWQAMGTPEPTRAQVAIVANYGVNGGSFSRYCTSLKSLGLIDYPSGGTMRMTKMGERKAAIPEDIRSLSELHAHVLGFLESGPAKILRELLQHKEREMGRTQLGELSGFEASGGTFSRYMTKLRSLQLIHYPKKTTAAAAKWLVEWRAA